uniref:Cell division protein ZapA n=1 Tax=candidate division WOR-3 bacterium TaxID=2052148 RepID=A0A7C2K393_UNCW3
MADLFSNIRGKRQIKFKNMEFEIFCDKEDEAILDEVVAFVEGKFKEEEERLSRMRPDIDWATVLVNVIFDLTYRYLILKKDSDKLMESVKFNIQRIDAKLGGPHNA